MNENYIIGATFNEVESTAWFNPKFDHSLPLSLNTLNRAILKKLAGDEYDIVVTSKPFWLRFGDETLEEAKARRVCKNIF